ncbi:hypothetical protein X975_08199, partial [Stegodyphus mimosarum]
CFPVLNVYICFVFTHVLFLIFIKLLNISLYYLLSIEIFLTNIFIQTGRIKRFRFFNTTFENNEDCTT